MITTTKKMMRDLRFKNTVNLFKNIPKHRMSNETVSDAALPETQAASTSQSSESSGIEPLPLPTPHHVTQENSTPSPLTMPSMPSNSDNIARGTEAVSVRCVGFIENENGFHLSVPQQPAEIAAHPYLNPYDSDGEEGPFFDAVAHELDQYYSSDEDDEAPPLPTIAPGVQPVLNLAVQPVVDPSPQPVAAQAQEQHALTEENINKMNVNQLKEELRKQNKSTTGVKKILQERLLGAIDAPGGTTRSTKKEDEAVPGFTSGAK